MTKEEIENIPETVDCLLDESVLEQTRATLKERLKEIGDLAIKALEQEPKEEQEIREHINRLSTYGVPNTDTGI